MTWRVPRGWGALSRYVLARDGYVCQLCLDPAVPADTVDHIIPRALGGRHVLGNLQAAHRRCNSSKGKRTSVMPNATIDARWG